MQPVTARQAVAGRDSAFILEQGIIALHVPGPLHVGQDGWTKVGTVADGRRGRANRPGAGQRAGLDMASCRATECQFQHYRTSGRRSVRLAAGTIAVPVQTMRITANYPNLSADLTAIEVRRVSGDAGCVVRVTTAGVWRLWGIRRLRLRFVAV